MNEFYNFERDAYEQELFSNKINPKFIPNVTEDKGIFKLLLLFDLK